MPSPAGTCVSSIGSYISAFGVLIFLYGVFEAFAKKRVAGDNPWGEGANDARNGSCPSPPPFHQWGTAAAHQVGAGRPRGRRLEAARTLPRHRPKVTESVIDTHESRQPTTAIRLSEATARDYFALLKPRVMSLVVFTAFVGLVLAPGGINPVIGVTAILGIAVGAGAAGALNMWYDADIDAVMTPHGQAARSPPAASGRGEALAFGLIAVGRLGRDPRPCRQLRSPPACSPSPSSSMSSSTRCG